MVTRPPLHFNSSCRTRFFLCLMLVRDNVIFLLLTSDHSTCLLISSSAKLQYENYWADNCMTHPPVTDENGFSLLAQLQNRFWACYVEGFHILSGTRSLCCITSIHIHEYSGFLKYRKSVVPLISWQLVRPKLCTRWSCYSVSHPVQG